MIAISVLSAVLPSLVLVGYFYTRDVNPEPGKVIFITFVLGILIVAPVAVLELTVGQLEWLADPYLAGLTRAFWEAAVPEELLKFVVVVFYCARHRTFDEPMDGMVYGAVASLGFATMENILYVTSGGLPVALSRALTAVPCHAFLGAIMGYYVGQARFLSRQRGRLLATGLGLAIVLHGLYDFPLLTLKALDYGGRKLSPGEIFAVSALSGATLCVLLVEGAVALKLVRQLRRSQLYHKRRLEKMVKEPL
jgi:RsiW-degrading membrane proteinase PrsW (M82 family)